MMNSRRNFLKQTGILAASAALAPSLACSMAPAKLSVGIQLYTLRDVIGKNIKGIIQELGQIGYKEVETYGYNVKDGFWGLKASEFAQLLKDNGMSSPSGHFDLDRYFAGKGTDQVKTYIEAANILGSTYITIPYIQDTVRKTADDYKKVAQKLNEVGELCKASGLRIAYHNHDFEFTKFGDQTGYDIMVSNTDKKLVDFELDLYWAYRSGNDALALFKKYPKRFTMWHVKDMHPTKKDYNAEIGAGSIDFKAIFKQAKQSGMKHFFVEQESNYLPNEMESVKTSFNYISKNLI